jgi:hypothetical protein
MPIWINTQNRHVQKNSEKVQHFRGQICSCSTSGLIEEADITCVKCHGLGVFWSEPEWILATIIGLHSDRVGKAWIQNGIALPDDMMLSIAPGYARSFRDYDKVIPSWRRGFSYAGELLRRGFKDTTIYTPVGRIKRVAKVNPESGEETRWVEGKDFTMGGPERRDVLWTAGVGPSIDDVYSITYEPRFEFVCWNPPASRWQRGVDLGRSILLRKVHLPWPTSNWS